MAEKTSQSVRSPVKREDAEQYLLLSLVSFAISVILTRFFLQITGYPQLGNSELHIAHVLWGGLLLFIASLFPLILANRWALKTSAVLSGVGVGLFIDEVGKFITQTNNYFYPPAAPIIYAFFLLTVLLYINIRKPSKPEPRKELYKILDGLTEVLDYDLDPDERADLENRLLLIADQTDDPNLEGLADNLVTFLRAEKLRLVLPEISLFQRFRRYFSTLIERTLTRQRLKFFLVIALGGMGLTAIVSFGLLIKNVPFYQQGFQALFLPLIARGEVHSARDALWFIVRAILEGGTGIFLMGACAFLIIGQERRAIYIATITLIVWMTVINLLVFYLDQFSAVINALFQFIVFLAVRFYRRKYLSRQVHPPASV